MGGYNGLQAKVAAVNYHAVWIPCAGHSLNLVGQASAECCRAAVAFFDFLEAIYVFFTASTHRYEILTDSLKTVESGSCNCAKEGFYNRMVLSIRRSKRTRTRI